MSDKDAELLEKYLRDLTRETPEISTRNHFRYPYYHISSTLPLLFLLPPIITYFFNPCINYTPTTLLWGVGAMYIIIACMLWFMIIVNDQNIWFCSQLQCRNHLLYEILLCASVGSSNAYYQMYGYFSGIGSVFCATGVLIMFIAAGFWYNCCFNVGHIRSCPQRYLPHLEIYQGNGCLKTFVTIVEVFIWIAVVVVLALMFAYNSQFLNSTRPAYNICQVPLTALNPP